MGNSNYLCRVSAAVIRPSQIVTTSDVIGSQGDRGRKAQAVRRIRVSRWQASAKSVSVLAKQKRNR